MELAKRVALVVFAFLSGAIGGGSVVSNLLNSKNYILPHDVYECAVGITMKDANYCLVYAAKGFIPKNETPSSGRRDNNLEQGRPIRSTQ